MLEDDFDEEVLEDWDELEQATGADDGQIDVPKLRREIADIANLIQLARSIHTDTKSKALLTALDVGFSEQQRMGAAKKALIFTESRRTQEYLRSSWSKVDTRVRS